MLATGFLNTENAVIEIQTVKCLWSVLKKEILNKLPYMTLGGCTDKPIVYNTDSTSNPARIAILICSYPIS